MQYIVSIASFGTLYDFDDRAIRKFNAASASFFTKIARSQNTVPSWVPFVSHASLNVDKNIDIDIGSNE